MINEDRIGFSSAYTEAVRPDDPRGQSGKRMLMVALAVVLGVILGSVVSGWLGKKGTPAAGTGLAAAPVNPAHVPPGFGTGASGGSAHPTWTAVAGPTCHAAGTSFSVSGYVAATSSSQRPGWFTSSSGGYSGGGCAGGFVSVPMSGHAQEYDRTRFALWKFDFSALFTAGFCRLYTYIPANPALTYVGGDPSYYNYYEADYPGGKTPGGKTPAPLGSYQVNQVGHRGSWVANSLFEVTTGKVTVELLDAGQTSNNARHAAAQVRLACWAA
jgi:hypothetical protein